MKFGKEFSSQMVPEWQEAYMNYNFLKTLLKDIHDFKHKNKPPAALPTGLKRRPTLYRSFSGLIHRQFSTRQYSPASSPDIESQTILINSTREDGSHGYHTTFLRTAEEGGEYELVYFRRLDEEFNKVDRFYKSKVDEVMKEASMLNKQMDALIAFRIKVENPPGWFDRSVEMTRLATDIASSTAVLASTTPRNIRASRRVDFMDKIEEGESNHPEGQSEETSGDDDKEVNETKKSESHVNQSLSQSLSQSASQSANQSVNPSGVNQSVNQSNEVQLPRSDRRARPAPLEILDRVTMNHTQETPRSTIKNILKVPKQTELTFNRENLARIEEQLKKAFVEFYQKLRLLKSFSFLNTLAFSKIMKKYDKITSRDASKAYMRMVDNSYLGSSDDITKLMERVEATYIKHFSNANRSKGMSILRPKAKRETHRTTFSTGFFAGCTAALILALILIIRARNIMEDPGKNQYMENMFPLYILFAFIVMHMIMYAANVYFWRKYRVNYSFIFGFKQGTELGYREVLLPSFILSALALGSVLSNLDMEMDPKTKDYKALTELLPLLLLVFVTAIMICPFNIAYRSSRFFFLTCLYHLLVAPLYKVTLPDFFLADQLTSQVQALRSVQFYVCYYGWGDYKHRQTTCKDHNVYKIFLFLIAALPYMSRLLQCLRRLYEEKDPMQGYNGIKYFLTIVAVSVRTAHSINHSLSWKVAAWVFSVSAAIVSTYWDLVIDWGLLERNSKNPWLRDKLLVPYKSVYFVAIGMNVLLRFAWLQTVLNFKVNFLHTQTLIAIVALLEILRRGIWNFFRLENEHLNNVGKYRAFKSVPLPFNYDEDEEKDE